MNSMQATCISLGIDLIAISLMTIAYQLYRIRKILRNK